MTHDHEHQELAWHEKAHYIFCVWPLDQGDLSIDKPWRMGMVHVDWDENLLSAIYNTGMVPVNQKFRLWVMQITEDNAHLEFELELKVK